MILTLSILLIVLVVALWLYIMYTAWKQDSGAQPALFSTDPFAMFLVKLSRLLRRGYYRVLWTSKIVLGWTLKHLSQLFLKIFPKAEPAFIKRNNLVGLKEGPTSYFLMSISEAKNEPQKSTRRRRKIV